MQIIQLSLGVSEASIGWKVALAEGKEWSLWIGTAPGLIRTSLSRAASPLQLPGLGSFAWHLSASLAFPGSAALVRPEIKVGYLQRL